MKPISAQASGPEPSRVFAFLAPIFGLLFLALTPPFQVPDEPEHYYRAYQLSEGGIVGRADRSSGVQRAGGFLPKSLKAAADLAMGDIAHNESVKANLAETRRALAIPLAPEEKTFIEFPSTVLYSPIPYLPQAAVAAAGRLVKAHPLILLYLMRLANLLAWLLLAGAAIRMTPIFKWVFLLLALAPMSLAQAASASADAVTNGAAFLFIALVLRAALEPEPAVGSRTRIAVAVLAAVVALGKPIYAVLPFFVLIIPAARLGGGKKKQAFTALVLAATIGLTAAWSLAASGTSVPLQAGVSAIGQVRYASAHPSIFLGALWHSLTVHVRDHFPEFIGQLGWLDVTLPLGLVWAYYLALIGTGLTDKTPGLVWSRGRRAFSLGLAAAGGLAVLLMIYAFWNPVGSPGIEGAQGRYFIPFGPLIFLALYNLRLPPLLRDSRPARLILAVFAAFAPALALLALVLRYYA
ncbi:MAG: DUF2142 domain-containing protein [Candidatus Aminicenantes bacterium]|nr:DUF2142 domain-containing protein [Candidatus Aminicenantes bacterium]